MINYSAIDPDFPGEKLLAGLRAVEARYGIHLTLHDCRGLLCHADGRPFFPDRCMHMHPYCITGRFEMPGWNRRCHEECKLRVEEAVNDIKGAAGSVNLKKGLLTVTYSEPVDDARIRQKVEKAGYRLTGVS